MRCLSQLLLSFQLSRLVFFCFAAITQSNTNTTLEMTSPDDFNISQNKIAAQFKHKLDQGNLKYHQRTYEVINPKH